MRHQDMNRLEIATLNPKKLHQLFKERTDKWPHPLIHEECYTRGLFDDFSDETNGEAAFKLISTGIDIALHYKNSNLFPVAIDLVSIFVRLSNTTEQPLELTERWSDLMAAVKLHQNNHYVYNFKI